MLRKAIAFVWLLMVYTHSVQAQTFIKSYNSINNFARLGNIMYYGADDGVHGLELWKTDGTAGGTVMVKDINPGPNSSSISYLTAFNGKVYFLAYDGITGTEVWQSDGTASGTKLLKDIFPGSGSAQPAHFTILNGALYFTATADGSYFTLWKTDGTTAGTTQITQSGGLPGLSQLTVVGNSLYFIAGYGTLYQSDGTPAGTRKVNVDDFDVMDLLHNVNNKLVFITSYTLDHNNIRLYQLDPADTTAVLLHAFQAVTYGTNDIGNITAAGTGFYFSIRTTGDNVASADALWKSDGTAVGTAMIKSFPWQSYMSGSYMQNFIGYNGKLYFAASTDHTLWMSDGSAGGTSQVSPVTMGAGTPVVSGQKFFFAGNNQLWSFNGSKAVAEITQPASPSSLFDDNGVLFFTTGNAQQLWNNIAAGQLQVTMGYAGLSNGGTSNFSSKADSAVTSVVTMKNTGNRELVFSGIGVAGASFYVNGQLSRTLSPGQQETFNLLYFPAKQGQDQAVMQIKSTDNSGQQEFIQNLSGTASGKATKSNAPAGGLEKSVVFRDSVPGLTLSKDTVLENAAVGTAIGTFKIAGGTGYKFTLVAGSGDVDNGSFSILNGQLVSATTFNYSSKSSYSVRVRAAGQDTVIKTFTISISNTQSAATGTCGPSFQSLTFGLYDAVYNGTRVFAAGSSGTVLVSDDDGQRWKKVLVGMGGSMSRLKFTDAKTGYLLGAGSTLLKTENNGDSWFPLISPDNSYPGISGMSFTSASVGYIFGSGGIYKTINGGRNWQNLSYNNSGSTLNEGAFIDNNNGFICGSSLTLTHTTDGGKTWQAVPLSVLGPNTNLNHIVFVNSKTGFISSSAGDILKTTDGGATWSRAATVSTDYVDRLYFLDENNGYLLAGYNSAVLYKTTDGGVTWNMENTGLAGTFTGLAVNSSHDKLCLVGIGTGLGSTSDNPGSLIALKSGSGNWTVRSDNFNGSYVDGNLFASGIGYVFGGQNLKTTDGGITWKEMALTMDYYNPVRDGYFLNADTGYYSSYYHLFKTTNGGTTWSKLAIDTSSMIENFYFLDAQMGFYTNQQNIYKTTDGGNTWKLSLTGNFSIPLYSINFVDHQTGFAAGSASVLYKTTDGGDTWTSTDLGNGYFFTSVYFWDKQNGFLGGADGLLLRTTDGGATWNPVITGMLFYTDGIQFTSKLHGYVLNKNPGGGANMIYETQDGGLTWSQIYITWTEINGFHLNDGQLILAGANGSIIKLSATGSLPANAGYITGDTTVSAGNRLLYRVTNTSGTNYKWTFTGSANAEYHGNSLYISWKQAGQYTLQVTPYNNCGTGETRTVTIQVQDMPEPLITGPDTVTGHTVHVPYATAAQSNEVFSWGATGGTVVNPAANSTTVSWGNPGNGTVTLVATDTVLNLKKSADLAVVIRNGTPALPADNFKVSVTGCTCKGSNNGVIRIVAAQSLNYTMQVTGPGGYSKNVAFTDSTQVESLLPGVYNACLGLSSDTGFHRCYELNVTEPKDLSIYSSIAPETGMLTLDLAGADSYQIVLNGVTYSTNATQINLQLNSGENRLKVFTDKLCQGVIEKIVNFHKITLYPNPFADHLSIDLGGSPERVANVQVASLSGKLLYNKDQENQSGILQVNLPGLMPGAYVLTLTLGQSQSIFKIIRQ